MVTTDGIITLGEQEYNYRIRRSHKARNVSLHVDLAGTIELVVPRRVAVAKAEQFVQTKHAWLHKQLTLVAKRRQTVPKRRYLTGEVLPFLDEQLELVVHQEVSRRRSCVRREGQQLVVTVVNQEQVRPALVRWYRRQARLYCQQYADQLASSRGYVVRHVAIGDFTSQWGSCSPSGRLAFSWRLMLAPAWIVHYVIAHEVAHLRYASHGVRFWQLVTTLYPQLSAARVYLRQRGHELVL